jgi:hypothetical protein
MDPPSWLYDDVSSINLCMDYNKPHVISFLNSSSYPKGQFSATKKDYSLSTKVQAKFFCFFTTLHVHIDDMLVRDMELFKDYFLKQFRIKDFGNLKYFLGIEVSC